MFENRGFWTLDRKHNIYSFVDIESLTMAPNPEWGKRNNAKTKVIWSNIFQQCDFHLNLILILFSFNLFRFLKFICFFGDTLARVKYLSANFGPRFIDGSSQTSSSLDESPTAESISFHCFG